MPLYEYQCDTCGFQIEYACKIAERPEAMPCDLDCPGKMRQIITLPNILMDDVVNIPWLQDFAAKRKEARFGGRPIQTRTEYRKYLKDNDLRPCGDGINRSEV